MDADGLNPSNLHLPRRVWELHGRVTLVKTIQCADVVDFARLTGDNPPMDDEAVYSQSQPAGRARVPPMLLGGLIGAAIQRYFGGAGSVCLHQYLEFIAPAYTGDTVTAALEVDHVEAERSIVRLKTACTNQNGQALVTGQAAILIHKEVNCDS